MKHETNGKNNWEQLMFAAVVAGTGAADADCCSGLAADDGCSE